VEGPEYHVLKGAKNALKSNNVRLTMEVHGETVRKKVISLLEKLKYKTIEPKKERDIPPCYTHGSKAEVAEMCKISALIFTRNSAHQLLRLLKIIEKVVDEVVIVDGCSEDNTVSIAKSYGAKVYLTKPLGYVEPCRMLGISKVTNEWVLYLDVDEVPSPNLIRDIKKIVNYATKHGYVAIRINRINFYVNLKKPLLHIFQPDYQVRVFNKYHIMYKGIVHEQPIIFGKTLLLDREKYFICHLAPETYTLKGLKSKLIKYAILASRMRLDKKRSMIFSLFLPLIFVIRLFKYLVIRRGILDGVEGVKAAFFYVIYLSMVDLLKAFRNRKWDILAEAINKHGLSHLCHEVEYFK